jgi:acetyl esterase/lipase
MAGENMSQPKFSRLVLMLLLGALMCGGSAHTEAAPPEMAMITSATRFEHRIGADAVIPLWTGQDPVPPLSLRGEGDFIAHPDLTVTNIARPYLFVFRPAHPNGKAILTVPGGAYQFVSMDNEGLGVAQAFTPAGYTVFALVYRLPSEGWAHNEDVAFEDGQRAVRVVRAQAGRYGIDPHKIGVMGFSAGGQLVSDLGTSFARETHAPVDAIDRLSARPDWVALIYPVILFDPRYTHRVTVESLMGGSKDTSKLAPHAAIDHIGPDTPPMFLLHAIDDDTVPVENSLLFAQALMAAHRPVELHLIPHGGHGFGTRADPHLLLAHWPQMVLDWRALMDRWPDEEAPLPPSQPHHSTSN